MLLKLPLRKGMRTDDAEAHKNLIFRLNRHIGKDRSAMLMAAGQHNNSLTIGMSMPVPAAP